MRVSAKCETSFMASLPVTSKTKNKNDMRILLRIIVFPLFCIIALIFTVWLWIKFCLNFLRYGGEVIAYNKKINPTTIKDVFSELQKTGGAIGK